METIEFFIIDSSWESLLTAVFESFRRKMRPRDILRRQGDCSLFDCCWPVIKSDKDKAMRVWRYVCRIADPMIAKMMIVAHSIGSERVDSAIFRVICKIMEGYRYMTGDYSDSDMAEILWTYRRASKKIRGRRLVDVSLCI